MDTPDILIRIRKIVRSINLESKKIQKEYGVSITQILCLDYLNQSENYQSTQGEIKKILNLNSSTTSGIIHRMETKGLIARLPKSGDKRVVKIALTSKGSKLLEKVPPLLQERLTDKLAKQDKKTLEQLTNSLDLLIDLLEIEQTEATPFLTFQDNLEEENGSVPGE